jgi:hypothetical protein
MRSFASAVALMFLSPAIFAESGTAPNVGQDTELPSDICPHTHELENVVPEEHWFEGKLGKSHVKVYLQRGGAGVVGLFYANDGAWTPTFLGGEWKDNKITLSAESAEHAPRGQLQGELLSGVFTGTWIPDSSDGAETVRLSAVQKPGCDGSGVWKRFDDPKWPVSFSYPASWRIREVTETPQRIQLTCPDPEEMTYNAGVTIYEGKGEPGGPWELVHCANEWRFGSSCAKSHENTASLSVSTVRQQPDETILNIDSEWRVYCSDGGYIGLGDGEDRVVLLPNFWVEFMGAGGASEIVDRLVKSADVRAEHNAK